MLFNTVTQQCYITLLHNSVAILENTIIYTYGTQNRTQNIYTYGTQNIDNTIIYTYGNQNYLYLWNSEQAILDAQIRTGSESLHVKYGAKEKKRNGNNWEPYQHARSLASKHVLQLIPFQNLNQESEIFMVSNVF